MNNVNFASYVDDNTPYAIGDGVTHVNEFLKEASDKLLCWFANNQMKANPDKCHLITSSSYEVSICVKNYNIKSSKGALKFNIWALTTLTDIKIDEKLNFNNYIDEICKKAGQICTVKRYCLYGLTDFFISVSYYPLVLMFIYIKFVFRQKQFYSFRTANIVRLIKKK